MIQNASAAMATTVLDELVRGGMTDLVLAPGSRSAPLAFAAWAASQAGWLRLHTRIDERSAAFTALGLARASRRPVAVVTTSGTAVANLHPAMLEAHHAGVPLIALTADRPESMRGTGANQTTDQVGIFGPHIQTVDVPVASGPEEEPGWRDAVRSVLPGPSHLNLQFAEPLVPGEPDGNSWPEPPAPAQGPAGDRRRVPEDAPLLPLGPRTVVIAGDDSGPPARVLAQDGNWPLLAEPSSGSRTGRNAIRTYRLLLEEFADRIERVVVFGHPTLSRPVTRLLARDDIDLVAVGDPWTRLERPIGRVLAEVSTEPDAPAWLEEWLARDAEVSGRLDALINETEFGGQAVARAVSAALPPGGLLFVGSSNPIRDLDLNVAKYRVGDRRMVVSNRGLAGIDGTLSSAIGAALGRPHSTRALALVGDVTFLHDTAGLVIGPAEPRPDITIVVVNDDGGSIFTLLEQGAEEYAASYERLFGTPHGTDIASLCAAFRIPHLPVHSVGELEAALASPNGGIEVVEALVSRSGRRDFDARLRALVRPEG